MINGQTVLAVIPARGGSKGIPRKNIRLLAGKPLIAWTIEEAKRSQYIDRLILSSEDEEIINVAQEWGCEVPFIRPAELAQDDTPGIEPVLHAIETLSTKYDYIVLLQPTSPFRTVEDIDECIRQCITENCDSCVTVKLAAQSPYWMYTISENRRLEAFVKTERSFLRRQDLPDVYVLNGAVYVSTVKQLVRDKKFVTNETLAINMPLGRSLDVDTEEDLAIAAMRIHSNEMVDNDSI